MNTAYIRFCASLLAVVFMATLTGALAVWAQSSYWLLLWLACGLSAFSAFAGELYILEKYRSAMLATEKAHAQIERLERQLDQAMNYRRHQTAEEWSSEIKG